MSAAVAPRRSLEVDASRSRSASVAGQNSQAPKTTLRRMFQDTLRATGLSRPKNRDSTILAKPPSSTQDQPVTIKEKEKEKEKEDTKRALRVTFNRKPKQLPQIQTNVEQAPFMGSLRQASMSSPTLHLSSNTFQPLTDSPANSTPVTAAITTPLRPRVSTRRSSREREPITPLQISGPRSLVASSPSTPAYSNYSSNVTRPISPPSRRNRSPPARMTHFSSISMSNLPGSQATRSMSPTYHSQNTSTASVTTSSLQRELIRTASSLLIKHLSRPPPPLKQHEWQDVEIRLRALSRLERIWGKSGGGSSATAIGASSGFGGGEERERKLFFEAVRDGYVLCALLNKFRPGTVARPDPKEDGFAKTSNVTKFLAGAVLYGVPNSDLFMRNDLLEATSDSLGRVAQTVISLVKLSEPTSPTRVMSGSPYTSSRNATVSSPNLLDSRSRSPSGLTTQRKRYSPPEYLSPVPGSSSGKAILHDTPQKRVVSASERTHIYSDNNLRSASPMTPSPPPPRSPLRASLSSRNSLNSNLTESTVALSSLDNRTSTRFGTIRTVTTEATSIHPSETSSIAGVRTDSTDDAKSSIYQTQFTDIPTTTRRRSYDREASAARLAQAVAQTPPPEASPIRPWRERRSSELLSNDLSNVEEVDEMGTRRGRPVEVAVASSLNPTTRVSPRRPSFDRPRVSFEDKNDPFTFPAQIDLSTTPPKAKAGLPMRRPVHGHRHSVDTVTTSTLLPVPRLSSYGREGIRRPSPTSSRDSSTPSPPTRPVLVPRNSTSRPSPRTSYVPKLTNSEDGRSLGSHKHTEGSSYIEETATAAAIGRVPFPRSTSGEHSTNGAGVSRLAALPTSLDTLVVNGKSTDEGSNTHFPSSNNLSNGRPSLMRGRYNSELDTVGTRTRRQRPNSFDDGGARPGRSRFESMINLGASGEVLARESSMSRNAIREPLIVREEGKPPMHYQIGNGIGRGQFGAVYRALNLNTGQMVAVKRISLQGLSEDEISNLMKEVDVLKRLSHPSIVKYEGMVRSTDTLSIVLEYVENGSLGQTLKAFGKLNERLVASYVTKILEGLHYLHTSHVVHCDLKAANILTTKNGNVKLSDFGVSLNLHAKALEEIKNDVAGTPNWMAPEIIELKGPSPASDIWSLGCTAVELLTGHPPYHEIHNGMSVMFRIVEDDMPPIPDICSEPMRDFLQQCFKKNPAERPSAETLFEHPWLKTTWGEHRELRPQDSIPFLRRVSVELARSDAGRSLSVDTRRAALSDSPRIGDDFFSRSPSVSQSPLSPDSVDGSTRPHSFIKTQFGKSVTCRVCHQLIKRSGVLCDECGLIAHPRCAADAPPSCDIRAQLLLYAQYSQASTALEVSTPTRESMSPVSAPISIPSSPRAAPRNRRQSDATYSSSPKLSERILGGWKRANKSPEPTSPSLPPVGTPPSNHPLREEVAMSSSPLAIHPPREEMITPTPDQRHGIAFPSSPKSPQNMRKQSRVSFQSTNQTDSMRSMVTAIETISSSTASYDSTPRSSVAPATARQMQTVATSSTHAIENGASSETKRLGSRMSTISSNASEFGEERRRIKRTHKDSTTSKDSQCIIQ